MDSHLFVEYGKSVDMGPWPTAGAKQPVHSFLGGKGLGIQQGMSVWVEVWVGSPKLSLI